MYYQEASLLCYLDEVLSGIFDDDFGLSDSESSEEEGENVYTYSGKHNLARGEVVALSKAVSSEPTEDHNDPGEFSVMSAVPMTVVVRMMIRKRPWSLLVSRAHAYTKNNCLFISASILPRAIAGYFP